MSADGSIVLDRVSVKFSPEVVAVADVSLSIRTGEFVSIVGPSGCGKTTLLNFAAGLLPQGVGSGGFTVGGKPPSEGNRDIAYMLARDALAPWRTAVENAELGGEIRGVPAAERRARALDLFDKVGLKGFENAYPKQLSQGMRQRVALARTFALASPILLMDEPFGALDAQTRLQMQELLLHVWDTLKRTVIFITHDIDEAIFLADTVYVMSARPGRIRSRNPVPLPRPRDIDMLTDPVFNALRRDILHQIREEAGKSGAAH